ncbi:MAG: LPS-assembly protein LptD [Pyrinomonadaceae bacterium]
MRFNGLTGALFVALMVSAAAYSQQTNPVDRQVSNPITDTPNINPVSPQQTTVSPVQRKPKFEPEGGGGEVVVYSDKQSVEGKEPNRVLHHVGNVDFHYGIYRLQADEVTMNEADGRIVAKGSVVFDQGEDQRITGATAVWNYKTKLGYFEDSTGFTNQTNDGTVIYFTADRVERTGLNELVVTNGKFTACQEAVPKWSFTAKRATIRMHDKLRMKGARFRVKDVAILAVPFASIPIQEKDRSSGFLLPTVGFSGSKGARISAAYFKTLGDSADITFRGDVYTGRGLGYGMDLRTRANSRSYFNLGFFSVKDRIFGHKVDADHPDQGGSSVYADGVHYFPNGFTAAVDLRLVSSLAFRQEFSDGIQQIISPIEVSQAFINKSWGSYTLNFLARSANISIPNVQEKTRNLPSISFERRPSRIPFFRNAYFSFRSTIEGVSRREQVTNLTAYQAVTGTTNPVVTPAIVQRLDVYPEITVPFHTKYVNFTAMGAVRATFYSNSFDQFRNVISNNVVRKYGEFQFDIRPVALAKNYYAKDDQFRFRHVIEPYVTYHYVAGINNFNRIIRFDEVDTLTDTNEIEFGVINRFYTRRYTEAVTKEAKERLRRRAVVETEDPDTTTSTAGSKTIQPYEIFSVTVRGKYFFDKTFGGALIPGRRNQIEPMTALSFYTFGGVPRRWSPLNIDATYRPQRTIFVSTRMDYGMQGDGLRDISATVGYDKSFVKFFQTFYYTRAVTLIPSLAQYADPSGKEAGTLRGSQWSPSLLLGNRQKGIYAGASFFLDFQNRRASDTSPMVSSLYTLGYAFDCCSVALQYYTFNVGVRNEHRFAFSFRLNGIGSFGTEQIGQGLR